MTPEEERETTSQDASSPPKVVVRSSKARRTSTRGFEGFGKVEQLCKSVALAALLAVIGIGSFSRFYASRFNYLENTVAIEQAEIARNLRSGDGFTTRIGYLPNLDMKAGEGRWASTNYHPLYSLLLSGFFRVRGSSDRGVALFNGLIHLLTGILVYLLATQLRGRRTGIFAVILYFVSIEAIATALSATGLTLTAFFLTLGAWAAIKSRAAQTSEDAAQVKKSRLWSILTGAGVGLAYLCGGLCVLLIIPIAALTVADPQKRAQTWALVCGTFLLVLAPWVVRNLMVTGTLSPMLARYQLIAGTPSYPGAAVLSMFPGELPNPATWALTHPGEIAGKLLKGSVPTYRKAPLFINIYLFPFLVLFGLGLASNETGKKTWNILIVMVALQLITALLYGVTPELIEFDVFLPLGLCLATVAAAIVLSRYVTRPAWRYAAVLGLIVVTAFPYATSVLGGKKPGYAAWAFAPLRGGLTDDAIIGTDMPAYAAWYSARTAVMLPPKVADLAKLKQHDVDPDYISLSSGTLNNPRSAWARVARGALLKDGDKEREQIGVPIPMVISPRGDKMPLFERHRKRANDEPEGSPEDEADEAGTTDDQENTDE